MVKNGGYGLDMPEELKVNEPYAGEFLKVLDDKRRVTIPAKCYLTNSMK